MLLSCSLQLFHMFWSLMFLAVVLQPTAVPCVLVTHVPCCSVCSLQLFLTFWSLMFIAVLFADCSCSSSSGRSCSLLFCLQSAAVPHVLVAHVHCCSVCSLQLFLTFWSLMFIAVLFAVCSCSSRSGRSCSLLFCLQSAAVPHVLVAHVHCCSVCSLQLFLTFWSLMFIAVLFAVCSCSSRSGRSCSLLFCLQSAAVPHVLVAHVHCCSVCSLQLFLTFRSLIFIAVLFAVCSCSSRSGRSCSLLFCLQSAAVPHVLVAHVHCCSDCSLQLFLTFWSLMIIAVLFAVCSCSSRSGRSSSLLFCLQSAAVPHVLVAHVHCCSVCSLQLFLTFWSLMFIAVLFAVCSCSSRSGRSSSLLFCLQSAAVPHVLVAEPLRPAGAVRCLQETGAGPGGASERRRGEQGGGEWGWRTWRW